MKIGPFNLENYHTDVTSETFCILGVFLIYRGC